MPQSLHHIFSVLINNSGNIWDGPLYNIELDIYFNQRLIFILPYFQRLTLTYKILIYTLIFKIAPRFP
jgi:hypothetical protein